MKEAKIQTRPFEYGDENESEWPPKYGTGKGGVWYYDKETRTMKEGYPPPKVQKFGEAPYIISDTLRDPYYHPGAQKWTESRSKLNRLDEQTGCITTDKVQPGNKSAVKERERERIKDNHESLHKAVAMVKAGTAPLSEETRELCKLKNEQICNTLGIDAFNVAGIKNGRRKKRR